MGSFIILVAFIGLGLIIIRKFPRSRGTGLAFILIPTLVFAINKLSPTSETNTRKQKTEQHTSTSKLQEQEKPITDPDHKEYETYTPEPEEPNPSDAPRIESDDDKVTKRIMGGRSYRTRKVNDLIWMVEDLELDALARTGILRNEKVYIWERADRICKSIGARLPTKSEWIDLIHEFQDVHYFSETGKQEAYGSLRKGGDSNMNLSTRGAWFFHPQREGKEQYSENETYRLTGKYWTADFSEKFAKEPIYVHIDANKIALNFYRTGTQEDNRPYYIMANCRCVQDTRQYLERQNKKKPKEYIPESNKMI